MSAAHKPIVCYVTDRKALGSADSVVNLRGKIRLAIRAGADWIQIREKDLSGRELLALTRDAVASANQSVTQVSGARVYVNDRLDVALAAGAAGVHLGGESLSAKDVIRWCRAGNAPADFEIGVSCHSIDDAREAERGGASYVFFGPVFDTPSKRGFGPPQGISTLAEVCGAIEIPVIAIGGVSEKNARECVEAGAAGIAAIRMFQDAQSAEDLADSVARIHALKITR
ncbi:MAG TPA: thiamine phosphate synthase [Candidatus Acidoferrum sp.]|nr:thiamine phosphate synthase [Candidatus Acidoferrum sp.]